MPDTIMAGLTKDALQKLQELAAARQVSLEDQVCCILNAALGLNELGSKSLVSKEYFHDNCESVLAAADQTPVFVFDSTGKDYLIVPQKEFDRLGEYFDRK